MTRCGIFVKNPGSGNVGLQNPPPLPVPLQILITVTHSFSDIYKNEKQKQSSLGSLSLLSNEDGHGNKKGKKINRFRLAKQQPCTLLHDHNVKVPNFTFCRDGDTRQQLSFLLFLNFDTVLQNSTPKTICHHLTN